MSEAVENYAKRYAEQVENVKFNTLLESIKNLMDSMKWSAEQAIKINPTQQLTEEQREQRAETMRRNFQK